MGRWRCVGWWLLSALGGLLIAVGQPSRPVLAVGAFEGSDDALAQQVRQQVVQTLSLSSRLHISDREHARAILQEQRLRETGLTGESEASAAPLPAAQWLLVGRITAQGDRLQIELSSLDVRTGALLTGGMEVVSGQRSDWQTLAQRAAERMHRRLTGQSLPVGFAIEPLPDEGVPPSENRRDYAESPYQMHIDAVLAQGWMRLYPDGLFRPREPVSACYFAALLQRLQAYLGDACGIRAVGACASHKLRAGGSATGKGERGTPTEPPRVVSGHPRLGEGDCWACTRRAADARATRRAALRAASSR
jgi:hypothetical protein